MEEPVGFRTQDTYLPWHRPARRIPRQSPRDHSPDVLLGQGVKGEKEKPGLFLKVTQFPKGKQFHPVKSGTGSVSSHGRPHSVMMGGDISHMWQKAVTGCTVVCTRPEITPCQLPLVWCTSAFSRRPPPTHPPPLKKRI